MRISDWSSDVCSSDLRNLHLEVMRVARRRLDAEAGGLEGGDSAALRRDGPRDRPRDRQGPGGDEQRQQDDEALHGPRRSEEHTSELQSLMRISYAVFCLKKKNPN